MPRSEIPSISAPTLWFFRRIVRGYFRRHFRAVLAQNLDALRAHNARQTPLILYGNHSSWWDPMTCVLLAEQMLPARRHYAPMDATALTRYPILRRIGIFPVEMDSPRGAVHFLRTAERILRDGGVLWITPQGRFADVRERPLAFRPGLAALAQRLLNATVLPMAVEYTFFDERLPETLIRVGDPVVVDATESYDSATATLEAALDATMNDLRDAALTRDPANFTPLFTGGRGPGGFYGLGKHLSGKSDFDHTGRSR